MLRVQDRRLQHLHEVIHEHQVQEYGPTKNTLSYGGNIIQLNQNQREYVNPTKEKSKSEETTKRSGENKSNTTNSNNDEVKRPETNQKRDQEEGGGGQTPKWGLRPRRNE